MEDPAELAANCSEQKIKFLKTWLEESQSEVERTTESVVLNDSTSSPRESRDLSYHSPNCACRYYSDTDFKLIEKNKTRKFPFNFGLKNRRLNYAMDKTKEVELQCSGVHSGRDKSRVSESRTPDMTDNSRASRIRPRARSLPPSSRVRNKTLHEQNPAHKDVTDMYKSKDDLDKPFLSCFPIQCCSNANTGFYKATSRREKSDTDEYVKTTANIDEFMYVSNNNIAEYKDANALAEDRMGCSVRTPPPQYTDLLFAEGHAFGTVMPDLLNPALQYRVEDSPQSSRNTRYTPPYKPGALHNTLNSCSAYSKLYPSSATLQMSRYSPFPMMPNDSFANALLQEDVPQYPPPLPNAPYKPPSFYFDEKEDCDSNAGTVFTFYDIEPGGGGYFDRAFSPAPSDIHTAISDITRTSAMNSSIMRPTPSVRNFHLNLLSKCILKFGCKGDPHEKQPGYFSCPRRVDLLHSGEFVVLDSENQTLQLHSSRGVCNKVYQFKCTIMDMRVWNSTTIALLYKNEIGLFDITDCSVQTVTLDGAQGPRVMDKMKDLETKCKYFVIAMLNEVTIYTDTGKVLRSIGNSPAHQPGTQKSLFRRINTLTVDPRNNDIYVLDGDLKMVYTFSHRGNLKTVLDTNSSDLGPVFNPMGMCMNRYGHLLVADTFKHRIIQLSKQSVKCLLQYSMDYYPNDVKLSSDGRLVVAINSEGRTFAGVRVYNYKNSP